MRTKKELLAEFTGIVLGDGHLSKYQFSIAGNSITDREYMTNHVADIIKDIFNVESKFLYRKDQNTMYIMFKSVAFVRRLESLGFKLGPKNDLRVPPWILENDNYMKNFVRGMIDTDGTVAIKKKYRKEPYYPVISIVSKNEIFIYQIADWLKSKNFPLWVGSEIHREKRPQYDDTIIYRVQLSGMKNLIKWTNTIGFSNKKHLDKAKKLMGRVGISPTVSTDHAL